MLAVNPGKYKCSLVGVVGAQKAEASRVALNRESYVVIRAGSEARQGPSYKQERIVLLQSDASMLSAATSMKASGFSRDSARALGRVPLLLSANFLRMARIVATASVVTPGSKRAGSSAAPPA